MNPLRIARHLTYPLARTALVSLLVAATGISQAHGSTVVRLQTEYDTHQVSESYEADLDELYNDLDAARRSDAELSERLNYHRPYHYEQHISVVDVETHLYSDYDLDGYFSHFSVSFDIDAGYGSAWVYARVYLRDGSSDYTLFHTTEVFEIYDNLSSDRYKIESKLVANYPAGNYDVLIEVFEAGDPAVRDAVDASTHQILFALPLESDRLDDGPRDVIIHGSVGSSTLGGLAILGLFVLRRRVFNS